VNKLTHGEPKITGVMQEVEMDETSHGIPVKGVIPLAQMRGGDEEDTHLLKLLAVHAQEYLSRFRWCKKIYEVYFGDGYGGVIAIFLFRIEPSQRDVDEWLWVVTGNDFPPAYLVTDICKTPLQVFERYLSGLEEWIHLAKKGKSSKEVMPIYVPPTPQNASELERQLTFLREIVLPEFQKPKAELA
jgi:hypothetical protein